MALGHSRGALVNLKVEPLNEQVDLADHRSGIYADLDQVPFDRIGVLRPT